MDKSKKIVLSILTGILLLAAGMVTAAASEPEQFRSRGSIRYQDSSGEEIIWDAGDLDMLFQYAAEGKAGMSRALGGVGTKFVRSKGEWRFTRNPQTEAEIVSIETAGQMREITFDLILQALEQSQTLPEEYTEEYTLASSDNLTLGRAAWSDGSLLRGNNHDLMESYLKGWLEGSGYKEYEPLYDGEGRWIGYRGKET
ncbi:MAG: hypothetical protein J6A08_08490 [Lachnospiraceae bacterium]|nr:hypothetical protein [Lachnospiraceae bacterium]